MRSKISFTVYGKNREDIRRKSLLIIAEFLDSHDLQELESKLELEIEAEAIIDESTRDEQFPVVAGFLGKVWARVK